MYREVIQTTLFSSMLDRFILEKKLSQKDFDEFEINLVKNPQQGKVIPGLGGLRKIRLKETQAERNSGWKKGRF
jgi:hypothetical protein